MKIKEYLESLSGFNIKGLIGKELKILEPYFESVEELKGKKIEIIEEITMIDEPHFYNTKDGIFFKQDTNPKLVTIKGFDSLSDNIKLYSIFLQSNDIFVRCSEDSLKHPFISLVK